MICPNDKIQMHQKARVGDGEANENSYASWDMKECELCHRQVIEFHAVIVVGNTEQARIAGAMLVARAAEAAI